MSVTVDRRPAESPMFPRAFRPRLRRAVAPLDAAAFLNVVLVGVLFYLVQSPFVLQPGVRIELPEAPFADGQSYDALVVAVSQEGMVFFNDRRVTLAGLRAEILKALHETPGRALIVEADRRVPHGTLVNIYNLAMDCGVRSVSLATRVAVAPETSAP
jgi:biopolymer transport protein ExbD